MLKSKIKFAREARKKVSAFSLQPSAFACSAFTLLELLVVIAILGILAALTVPVLKNFGKSDATLGASRQLLDGVARARQMAMSQRTTIYMVFVPTNYWIDASGAAFPNQWFNNLSPALQTAVTNLADRQLSGYNFLAFGAMGDQPGQHAWHYLDRWQGLPDGTFIALQKFTTLSNSFYSITDPIDNSKSYNIYGFNVRNDIPFPATAGTNSFAGRILLPYLAFNYLGQLTVDGQNIAPRDEFIPLAHGSVMAVANAATKAYSLLGPPSVFSSPDVAELPPGNSTNLSYNIVHVDRLTGRAVLEFHKLK
ncbi:MAG: type II secretion system protein [Verrucomicrobiia bacterium]